MCVSPISAHISNVLKMMIRMNSKVQPFSYSICGFSMYSRTRIYLSCIVAGTYTMQLKPGVNWHKAGRLKVQTRCEPSTFCSTETCGGVRTDAAQGRTRRYRSHWGENEERCRLSARTMPNAMDDATPFASSCS